MGQRQGDLIVIEKGVQAGERVVTDGQLGVTPGGKVAPNNRAKQTAPQPRETDRSHESVRTIHPAARNDSGADAVSDPVWRHELYATAGQRSAGGGLSRDSGVVGYPGASPDTIANNIATPLERQFMQINGLEVVTSKSTQGVATFTLQFALDKNIDAAATDVQTAISQATGTLPADLPSPPTYSKTNPNDQPIMYIAMTSDSVTPGQLYDYASTNVGQRLSILPGVSQVNVYGTKSAIRIKANPAAMWARGISIDDLSNAIKNGTSYTGAGQFDSPTGTAILRPQGQLETAEQYSNLIVGGTNERRLSARRRRRSKTPSRTSASTCGSGCAATTVPSATVIVAVNRRAGANAVEVSKIDL